MIKSISRYLPVVLAAATAAVLPMSAEKQKCSTKSVSRVQSGNLKSVKRAKSLQGPQVLPVREPKSPFSRSGQFSSWRGGKRMMLPKMTGEYAPEQVDVPTMYGSIVYNDLIDKGSDYGDVGLYEIPKSGSSQPDMLFMGPKASYGGVLVDNIYYATDAMSVWGFDYVMIYGYDVNTGSNEVYIDGSIDNLAPGGITSDPTTGMLYGIFYTEDKQNLQLGTISYDDGVATTTSIAVLEGNWNTISCDAKGQLYAISYTGEMKDGRYTVTGSALQKLDKKTGEATKVGDLEGYAPQYLSGSVIDPKTNLMYWNYCKDDGTSYMCRINPENAEITTLYKLALNDEIMGMYIPTPEADAKAPAECTSFHATFDAGSLEGEVSFTAPATLFDSTPGTGQVNVTVLISGEEVMNKKVKYGEECKTSVKVEEAGLYTFTVFASNDAGEGPRTNIKHMWVGPDTPSATKASLTYEDGKMKLSWNPVTSAINGGYLNLDNLSYTVVRYPDAKVVAENYKAATFEEAIEEPADRLVVMYYVVTASCDGLSSAPARTESIALGNIVPPYLNSFDSPDDLEGWVTEDSNEDEVTWAFSEWDGGDMRNSFSDIDADDWLITPAVKLEQGKAYYVNIDARGTSTTWKERVEMKYGRVQSGEGMTGMVAGPLEITNNDFTPLGHLFVPEEDGIYYFGIHAISDAAQLDLVVDNFSIAEGVSALAPGEPTDLKIVPDVYGKLTAEISFKAPSVDLQNKPLASLTKVEVSRNDEVIKTFQNPKVGALLSFTDNLPKEGDYTYKVTGYNDEGIGLSIEGTNYIGVNLPAAPAKVKFNTTIGSGMVTVVWDGVASDINGNPVLAENITYNVYSIGNKTTLLAEGLTATSYSYQAVPEGEQQFVQCAVCAVTMAGEGDAVFTDMIPVGVPYDKVDENFADGNVIYDFGALSIEEGQWQVCTDASLKGIVSRNGDNGFLACRSMGPGSGAELMSGLVDTKNMKNPSLSLYVYNVVDGEDDDDNMVTLQARKGVDSEFKTLLEGTVNDLCEGVEGWHRLCVSLQEYAGSVVQVKIITIGGIFIYTCIDDIRIDSMFAHDLTVSSFEGANLVECGQPVALSATVDNLGSQDCKPFELELFADGVSIEKKEVGVIKAGASASVEFAPIMSAMATTAVTYKVAVVSDEDENSENDFSGEWKVTPAASSLPAVTTLAAELDEDKVRLSWSEPALEDFVPQITEDFEDGEAFSAEYGNWTFVDVDGSPVGGFQDMEIPGITIGSTTGSFWMWDTASLAGDDPTFTAHSGTHYLFSLFRVDDKQVDDWAISPALHGGRQTISFYAKSYSSSYFESVEVYYSTGSLDPKDFIKVHEMKKVPNTWRRISAELPEGAKRFAIRSCATGAFMLMVDDVTYAPEGAKFDSTLLGFDIYRDGVKINDKIVEDFEFTDSNIEIDNTYTYNVVAVYDSGISAPSNTATVDYSAIGENIASAPFRVVEGGMEILVSDASPVSVSAANGILYYNGNPTSAVTVKLNPGVYMIKIGRNTYKVVVK